MPFQIEEKLVVGVSSTALFDFTEADNIFKEHGIESYIEYQKEHKNVIPDRGGGFPFISRLLHLNDIFPERKPIEVIILSRNHPEASLRVTNAVENYKLPITRFIFRSGLFPYPFMTAINACLYLSTNADEVKKAVDMNYPAGLILPCKFHDDPSDTQLRIAFDFDGVIVDDEAEKLFREYNDLPLYQKHEVDHKDEPLPKGPLYSLLKQISEIQRMDIEISENPEKRNIRIAIVTARNAPAHERLLNTLSAWGISTDELFLLGGIEKKSILDVLKPHIFFDDQLSHLKKSSENTPSVHIPFGIANLDNHLNF